MWRLKRNCMKRWKTLQRAYKCSLASSKGSRKSQSQINCTTLWECFRISWKKWLSSFGDGWTVACVRVHSSSSGCICDWLVGSSQTHLCWLSIGESNCTEEQNWRFQRRIWRTSSYRYPKARSGLCAWYLLPNLTDLWLVLATRPKNAKTAADKKPNDLASILNRLRHHNRRFVRFCSSQSSLVMPPEDWTSPKPSSASQKPPAHLPAHLPAPYPLHALPALYPLHTLPTCQPVLLPATMTQLPLMPTSNYQYSWSTNDRTATHTHPMTNRRVWFPDNGWDTSRGRSDCRDTALCACTEFLWLAGVEDEPIWSDGRPGCWGFPCFPFSFLFVNYHPANCGNVTPKCKSHPSILLLETVRSPYKCIATSVLWSHQSKSYFFHVF